MVTCIHVTTITKWSCINKGYTLFIQIGTSPSRQFTVLSHNNVVCFHTTNEPTRVHLEVVSVRLFSLHRLTAFIPAGYCRCESDRTYAYIYCSYHNAFFLCCAIDALRCLRDWWFYNSLDWSRLIQPNWRRHSSQPVLVLFFFSTGEWC